MENKQTCRDFLVQGSQAGISCCLPYCGGKLLAITASNAKNCQTVRKISG